MATTTMVRVPCGRCGGDGHWGGQVAGGVCFGCQGTGRLLVTAAAFLAARKRDQEAQARRAENACRIREQIEQGTRILCGTCEDTGRDTITGGRCGCYDQPGYRDWMRSEAGRAIS